MWKWLVTLVSKLFGTHKTKQLQASKRRVGGDDIEVRLITPNITEFKDSILSVKQELGFSYDVVEKAVEKTLTTTIPKKYKEALKCGQPDIILTSYDFQGSIVLLQKVFPILKSRLIEIGVSRVTLPCATGIFIETDNITRASEMWTRTEDPAEQWLKRLNTKLSTKVK